MSGLFTAQLDFEKKTKDGQCSRSEACLNAGLIVEAWENSEWTAERCKACSRLISLVIPSHLMIPAQVALRFDSLKEGGARFEYPNALDPYEWTLIEALQDARRKGQMDAVEQNAKEIETRQRESQFEADIRKMRGTG